MIECNVYLNKPRELDGKKVYARFSNAFVEKATLHVFTEIPEGREASDFLGTMSGMIRNDQTGVIYQTAHDVEDAPYTYTEVFPNPRQLSEYMNVSGMFYRMNTKPYPDYSSVKTYKKGDRVLSHVAGNQRVYESEFDDNTGNPPNIYGWDMVTPYVPDYPEPDYVTIEEFNAIIDEMAAEAAAEAEQTEGED